MIWWLEDTARARAERRAIANLEESVNWLKQVRWRVAEQLSLLVDFAVEWDGKQFPLTLTFTAFHPSAPPTVIPHDRAWLSAHQYASGSLCLEFRADNWRTEITGAMMIESAYRLVAGERAVLPVELPSAHALSLGQTARGSWARFLVTSGAEVELRTINPGQSVELSIVEKVHAGTYAYTVADVGGTGGVGAWPPGIGRKPRNSWAIRLQPNDPMPKPTRAEINALLDHFNLKAAFEAQYAVTKDVDLIVITDAEVGHFMNYDGSDTQYTVRSHTLLVEDTGRRLGGDYGVLSMKSVGLVGCGSLGSKVAASLARSGIRRFVLVDDDVFLAPNLVRNELSASAVGLHKVDALRKRLLDIAGTLDITIRRLALGGQESADATDLAMSDLGNCDVIVDATADPHCFNFCAAVAKTGQRPMIWGEVFAGGIGGIVARVRPNQEPEPQDARAQVNAWCEGHASPVPDTHAAISYAGSLEGTVHEADDGDVSCIASHVSRLVVDTLVRPDASDFPEAAYAIGLKKGWIFSQPFETWPIALAATDIWSTTPVPDVDDTVELLRELFPAVPHGDDLSAQ